MIDGVYRHAVLKKDKSLVYGIAEALIKENKVQTVSMQWKDKENDVKAFLSVVVRFRSSSEADELLARGHFLARGETTLTCLYLARWRQCFRCQRTHC